MNRLEITPELLARYDIAAPRYTSYPPIPYWPETDGAQVREWLATSDGPERRTLSLYVHIPFCEARCTYCGCQVIVTPHHERAQPYLDALTREMALTHETLPEAPPVTQLHLGGGTPTYVPLAALERLVTTAREHFPFTADAELSIEVDPRTVGPEDLAALRAMGFDRLSLGIQDFDPDVQEAVNRVQSVQMVRRLMASARAEAFHSVNFDLIYGLPRQSPEGFRDTLEAVRDLAPDRIALYHYAHLPQALTHQRKIAPGDLPDRDTKLELFQLARETLLDWDYVAIGLDHFAQPDDELSLALADGTLQRNFMGYTTRAGNDLLAFGVSAISDYRGAFWQNEKKLSRYESAVAAGQLPGIRGMKLSEDDRLRKRVIGDLFCGGRVEFAAIGEAFGVEPAQRLATELAALDSLAEDDLVRVTNEEIRVTPIGQYFLRNIAVVFDAYHGAHPEIAGRYSRTA